MDSREITIMQVLGKLCRSAYPTRSKILPILALWALENTTEYGITEHAPRPYAIVALMLSGVLQNCDAGSCDANHALKLIQELTTYALKLLPASFVAPLFPSGPSRCEVGAQAICQSVQCWSSVRRYLQCHLVYHLLPSFFFPFKQVSGLLGRRYSYLRQANGRSQTLMPFKNATWQ